MTEGKYTKLANEYLEKTRRNYGPSRINHNVRDFVKGFAWYIEQQEPKMQMSKLRGKGVAIITEHNNHLTGGRYYTWMIALALAEADIPVTIYTNQEPTFLSYFKDYKQPNIIVLNCRTVDLAQTDIKADVYIGSPIHGSLCAIRNAKKYNKPSYAMIFDPFPMMAEFRGKMIYRGWDALIPEMKDSDCNILTLCESAHPYITDWLSKPKDKLVSINPCINSLALNSTPEQSRQDFVLFISRIVPNKKFEHTLGACKDSRVNLKVITSISGLDHRRMVQKEGMVKRTEFLFKVSDSEKFKLLKQAKAFISSSIYEGWGIPHTEALACGTPVVCYEFPTFREIEKKAKAENMYFAKFQDKKDLGKKLAQALEEKKFTKGTDVFNFESMVDRVKEVYA